MTTCLNPLLTLCLALLALSKLRDYLLRPLSLSNSAPDGVAANSVRFASSSAPAQDPKVKANALIEALPGNSLVSKTGWVTLTTALTGAAVSNEIFVLNEEVVILGSFIVFMGYLSTVVRGPYREWADGQIQVRPRNAVITQCHCADASCFAPTESQGYPQHVAQGAHRRRQGSHRLGWRDEGCRGIDTVHV